MSLVFRQSAMCCSQKFKQKSRFDSQNIKRYLWNKSVPLLSFIKNPNPAAYVNNHINSIINWYEEMSGLKDVRIAQEKVTEASDRLATLHNQRRQASAELAVTQRKLKQLYAEMDNAKRGEDRYVQLITQENKLLKEEESRQGKFKEAEEEEREQFTILLNALKTSHEKEKFQANRTRYWSIIGSVLGAILGIIGTSINNHLKFLKWKKLLHESNNDDFKEQMKQYMKITDITALNVKKLISKSNNNVKFKTLEEMLSNSNSRMIYAEEELRKLKYSIITFSLLCILMPIFTHCLSG